MAQPNTLDATTGAAEMIELLQRFCCRYGIWSHWPDGSRESGGMNTLSVCRVCGKRICLDSQGSWFSMSPPEPPISNTITENNT
jgi:hypothetical protein